MLKISEFDSFNGKFYIFNIKHIHNTVGLELHSILFSSMVSCYDRSSFNTKDFASALINDDSNKSI